MQEVESETHTKTLEILSVDAVSIAETLQSLNCTGRAAELRNRAIQHLEIASKLIQKMLKLKGGETHDKRKET